MSDDAWSWWWRAVWIALALLTIGTAINHAPTWLVALIAWCGGVLSVFVFIDVYWYLMYRRDKRRKRRER